LFLRSTLYVVSLAAIFAIGYVVAYVGGGFVYAHVVIPAQTRIRVARMAAELEEEAAREDKMQQRRRLPEAH
jgi:uncharacterized membrane protein YciS (DUF1049 family)